MLQHEFTRTFLKDMKRWRKAGKSMQPFEDFLLTIRETWPPAPKYEAHVLVGSLSGIWDIHLRQNWIVLARFESGVVRFLRMGTHAELSL